MSRILLIHAQLLQMWCQIKANIPAHMNNEMELCLRYNKHLKKSNAACFYTPIVLKLLIIVQM